MPTKYKGTLTETRALNAYIKLQRAAETSITRTTAHLSDYNLTTSQFAVLEALYHLGTLSQRDLAEKLLKSTGNMSIVLKNMDKRGLITRERDPEDNRYMRVCITQSGRELINSMLDEHVAGIVSEMSILTAAEQEELARLCRKLGLRRIEDKNMKKIQTQGIHHVTMIGADRQTSIDFWEGVLGMPFVFEQPNLDVQEENHLYFDPGDGRLITVFTNENRQVDATRNPEGIGNLHHLAFTVSLATFTQIPKRLDERGISHTGEVDRGFMDSIYFRDPLGQLIECAAYKFDPPHGATHVEVLHEAHKIRVAQGDHHIGDKQLAEAIELLVNRYQSSLSDDRSPKDPYAEKPPVWD